LYAANWLAIDPSEPVAGVEVHVEISWGGGSSGLCRLRANNLDGVLQYTTVDGSTIHLDLVLVVLNPEEPPPPCSTAPHDVVAYSLGSLDAGSYTLVVSEVAPDTTFPVSDAQRTELTSVVFGVAPAPLVVPVNHPLVLALLAGILLLLAGMDLRRRRT